MKKSGDADGKREIAGVVLGHCRSGKSTLVGRILCDTSSKSLTNDEKEHVEKAVRAAGRLDCRYSWLLDTSHTERESGGSIDLVQKKFETGKYHVTITDCPGNVSFLKNTLRGSSQADFALIVIDASTNTADVAYKLPLQTREHSLIAYALGIHQVIVVVGKMEDTPSYPYDSQRFDTIQAHIIDFLLKIGYNDCNIQVIPASGLTGDNVVKCPRRPVQSALRIPIQDVYKVRGIGTVVTGRLASGMVNVGMKVSISPGGSCSEIGSIELNGNAVEKAIAGDTIGFSLKGIAAKEIQRGHVCRSASDSSLGDVMSFTVCMTIVNHPGKVAVGYSPVVNCHTAQFPVKVSKLVAKIDQQSGSIIEKQPPYLKQGDAGIVRMTPGKPVCVEVLYDFPFLGRLVVRDLQQIVAVGVVSSVSK